MVTKLSTPVPPTHEGLKKMPPIEPAKPVSGFTGVSIPPNTPKADKTFSLPEKVSAKQVQADSFRYGGGRSAGKLGTKK